MKRIFITIILMSFLVSALSAQQRAQGKLFIHTGYAVPVEPGYFSDYWNSVVNFGIAWDYPLFRNISLKAGVRYHNFLFDDQKWSRELNTSLPEGSTDFIVSGAMKSLIIGSVDIKLSQPTLGGRLSPYLTAGVGAIYDKTEQLLIGPSVIDFKSELRPAYGLGAGLTWSVNDEFSLLFEGNYQHGLTKQENTQQVPIKFGETYSEEEIGFFYIKFGAGYNF